MRSGNILKEIWLEKENVFKTYQIVGREDIKNLNNNILKILRQYSFEQAWIEQFKNDMICYIEEKHKTNNLLPYKFASDILKVLKKIDSEREILKRVLSINCFGDSKYFEKNIEHIIVRIIKTYLLENAEEYMDEDVLLEVGISKYPEVLEFCGDLDVFIKDEKIEYKKLTMRELYQ